MAYSEEEKTECFTKILSRIREGERVRNILKDKSLPSSEAFYIWLDNDETKSKQYVRATNARAELKYESIEADYSEEPERDKATGKIDTGWVQLQRLKIDAKKWELSKEIPKKYGDKQQIEATNTNMNVEVSVEEARAIAKAISDDL